MVQEVQQPIIYFKQNGMQRRLSATQRSNGIFGKRGRKEMKRVKKIAKSLHIEKTCKENRKIYTYLMKLKTKEK